MADGQGTFGGGGSVHFEVDVNDCDDAPQVKPKGGPRAYVISGVDKHRKKGEDADYFIINIQPPPGKVVRAVPDGQGLRVFLEVDPKESRQMLVEWAFKEADVPRTAVDVVALLNGRGAPTV